MTEKKAETALAPERLGSRWAYCEGEISTGSRTSGP
jgi:hypothetical protein